MQRSHTKGFTLVEMMIYCAVLVFAASVVVVAFLSLRTVFERNRAERHLADSATSVMERIVREVRSASGVVTTTNMLELTQSSTTTQFYIQNGDVMMTTKLSGATTSTISLDSPSFVVTDLTFVPYTSASTTLIRTTLIASIVTQSASTTQTFTTATVLRGL